MITNTPFLRTFTRTLTLAALALCCSTASAQDTVVYFHSDAVGSVRMVTNTSGTVLARYDYLPFGEDWPSPPTGQERRRFTGQERDTESGWDYFGARYYERQTARFLSADEPVFGDPFDPPSMNLYAYARNNPLRFVDPTGHNSECKYDACVTAPEPFDASMFRFAWDSLLRPILLPETPGEAVASIGINIVATAVTNGGASSTTVPRILASARLLRSLGTARTNLLATVQNHRLRNTIANLYRPGAKLGGGSSMDALRLEGSHLTKVLERRTDLQRILREENLDAADKQIVKRLLVDIQDALSGHIGRR